MRTPQFLQLDGLASEIKLGGTWTLYGQDFIVLGVCALVLLFVGLACNHALDAKKSKQKCTKTRSAACVTGLTSLLMPMLMFFCVIDLLKTPNQGLDIANPAVQQHAYSDGSFPMARFMCLYFATHCQVDTMFGCFRYINHGFPEVFGRVPVYCGSLLNIVYGIAMVYACLSGIEMAVVPLALAQLPNLFLAAQAFTGSDAPQLSMGFTVTWVICSAGYLAVAVQMSKAAMYIQEPLVIAVVWIYLAEQVLLFAVWAYDKLQHSTMPVVGKKRQANKRQTKEDSDCDTEAPVSHDDRTPLLRPHWQWPSKQTV